MTKLIVDAKSNFRIGETFGVMSETERVLEEISKSVAESVVGVPNSQEEAGGSTSGQTSLPRSGAKEESDSESELFRSPTGSRRLSFEELLHKDPRYKKRTMDDDAMKQLILVLLREALSVGLMCVM